MWERMIRNVWEPLRGRCRRSDLERLYASQWDSPATIRARQFEQLSCLVRHAYEHVPYYRRCWQSIGFRPDQLRSVDDLRSLPFLSKRIVRNEFRALQVENIRGELHRKRTSGSTGSPLEIVIDSNALAFKHAITRRSDEWSGWRAGQPVAKLWGMPDYRSEGLKGTIRNRLIDRSIHLNTLELTPERMDDFLRIWNRHAPALLFGHAHSLYLLALHAKQRKFMARPARGIISSAMPLHNWQRRKIEEVFEYRVTDRYGCEETSLIACQCERGAMHIAAESVLVEIVEGRVIVTDLVNRAMPLIRYEIGDCAELGDEVCPCGRGLPTLKRIAGREADFIATPDGRLLSGISLTENFILKLPDVVQVQIVQEEMTRIHLRIVPNNHGNRIGIHHSALELGRLLLGPTMRVDVEFVSNIPSEASGKYRFCISNVSQDFARSVAA